MGPFRYPGVGLRLSIARIAYVSRIQNQCPSAALGGQGGGPSTFDIGPFPIRRTGSKNRFPPASRLADLTILFFLLLNPLDNRGPRPTRNCADSNRGWKDISQEVNLPLATTQVVCHGLPQSDECFVYTIGAVQLLQRFQVGDEVGQLFLGEGFIESFGHDGNAAAGHFFDGITRDAGGFFRSGREDQFRGSILLDRAADHAAVGGYDRP